MPEATSKETTARACPHCGAQSEGVHFCAACGRILPLAVGGDYFAFFGLPRKLGLDERALEQEFYALSRQLHPDYFMNASEAERQASVERASRLNDAYRTLRDRTSRAAYLLSLAGYKEAEKKAPPGLLEEVFELNMQVEEMKAAKKMGDEDEVRDARAALEEALGGLKDKMDDIDARLFASFADWDAAVDRGADERERKPVLDRMSELLSHRSYLRNLVRDIREEL
ncbi:MAG TPA: Fe-S protein assembly co-chaperone HscB [Blastocatellia bacterium]|nr:Fe-S protein assembly co-chaperone HscB [Blastocatellia bacterium]